MLSFIKKHPFLIIFLLFTGYLVRCSALNYSGYCVEEGKYLSDEEKIRRVLEELNKRDKVPVYIEKNGSKYYVQYYKRVKYKNVDEFLAQNPNCCEVVTEPYKTNPYTSPRTHDNLILQFIGQISDFNPKKSNQFVTTNRIENYIDEKNIEQSVRIKNSSQNINNCGQIMTD